MRSTSIRARAVVAVAIATAMLATGAGTAAEIEGCEDPATLGCWSAPFSETGKYDEAPPSTPQEAMEFPTAVTAVVLPSGRVVYWDGLGGFQDSEFGFPEYGSLATLSRSRVLDLDGEPVWIIPDNDTGGSPHDLFCTDQRLLPDGRLVAAGGTDWESNPGSVASDVMLTELYGSKHTRVFDEELDAWSWDGDAETEDAPSNMHHARWYPTVLTLPSGELMAMSGVSKLLWNSTLLDDRASDVVSRNVYATEIFDPETSTWTDNGPEGEAVLPLYPRVHLLPNGDVFYTGAGQFWGPAGQDVEQFEWNFLRTYDPDDNEWTEHGFAQFGGRNGAFSAMLPLVPDQDGTFADARFLVGGGTLGMLGAPGTYLAQSIAEIVTASMNGDGVLEFSSSQVGDLVNARWHSSAVPLPNGQVLVFSGADKDEVIEPGTEAAIHQAELFDPESNTWTGLSSGARDRTYHNSALLLPDGRILVGGHSPINFLNMDKARNDAHDAFGTASNFRDPSFEIFTPPYLFTEDGSPAPRPEILSKQATATYGNPLNFSVAPGSPEVDRIVMTRMPSVTHVTDPDMRTVDVTMFTDELGETDSNGADKWQVTVPDDANVLPPGFYYLFALTEGGVPSVAHVVSIS